MYCLDCLYNLHGLTVFRCPECGRDFNPHDHRTWRSVPYTDSNGRVWFWAWFAGALFLGVVLRNALGSFVPSVFWNF